MRGTSESDTYGERHERIRHIRRETRVSQTHTERGESDTYGERRVRHIRREASQTHIERGTSESDIYGEKTHTETGMGDVRHIRR